jgi:TPR repeat protein
MRPGVVLLQVGLVVIVGASVSVVAETDPASKAVGAATDSAQQCKGAIKQKDYDAAVAPCTKAAEQGTPQAQYELGLMYATGSGVPKDHILAFLWLDLAATQGHKDAAGARDTVRKRMIPEQIDEAERLTFEWYEKFSAKQDGD